MQAQLTQTGQDYVSMQGCPASERLSKKVNNKLSLAIEENNKRGQGKNQVYDGNHAKKSESFGPASKGIFV